MFPKPSKTRLCFNDTLFTSVKKYFDSKCKLFKTANFDLLFGLLHILEKSEKGFWSQIKKQLLTRCDNSILHFPCVLVFSALKTIIATSGAFFSHRGKVTLILKKLLNGNFLPMLNGINSYDLIFRLFGTICFPFYFIPVSLLSESAIVFANMGGLFQGTLFHCDFYQWLEQNKHCCKTLWSCQYFMDAFFSRGQNPRPLLVMINSRNVELKLTISGSLYSRP